MPTSKSGLATMPSIVRCADGGIRHRLWTLYWLARMTEARVIVELGTREGDSTRALLAAAEDLDAQVISYDLEGDSRQIKVISERNKIPWFGHRWTCRKSDSALAGHRWSTTGGGPVDLLFIDTDHTWETTRAELTAWHAHIRPGGCIAFHDYWLHDPPRDRDQGRGVKLGVDEFADRMTHAWTLETHDAGPDGDTGFAVLWRHKEVA